MTINAFITSMPKSQEYLSSLVKFNIAVQTGQFTRSQIREAFHKIDKGDYSKSDKDKLLNQAYKFASNKPVEK